MLPVMLAARKLDSEDANIVYWLRLAYGTIQTCCVLLVAYTYVQASATASTEKAQTIVCVPAPPQPFEDPNAKKKYTKVKYGAHLVATARSLLGSTLFGIFMTVALHLYKGMIAGVAIQTIMGPINLLENPLIKALILGNGFTQEDKIFNEKSEAELTRNDEVVDESGNILPVSLPSPFENILLDTWDGGNKADIGKLMDAIDKNNVNFRTTESKWTPLMIVCGLQAKGASNAIIKLKELGGNPALTDADGWNALHWAAFHGSLDAAKELVKDTSLMTVKDKEGKVPLDLAIGEKNDEVAKFLETVDSSVVEATSAEQSSDGLRKRK